MSSIAIKFGIGKSTVSDIVKSKAKLEEFQTEIDDGDCTKKPRVVRKSDFPELDRAVYLWFVHQRCKGETCVLFLLVGRSVCKLVYTSL